MTDLSNTITLLLVEDNAADVFFFKEALESARICSSVHVASHGEEGLQFLQRRGRFAGAPRPDVIVLDLNLPIMNGQEMLLKMMAEPNFRNIPVAVLTTSTSERYVCEICSPGQCLYFTKTDDFNTLQEIILQIATHAQAKKVQACS